MELVSINPLRYDAGGAVFVPASADQSFIILQEVKEKKSHHRSKQKIPKTICIIGMY